MNSSKASKKFEVDEIHDVLRFRNALVVHFSGVPKGAGVDRGNLFPNDLTHMLKGGAMGGVSCSVVMPNDVFSGFSRNAIGCIGLILDLSEPSSLVAVSEIDCGSVENEHGIRTVGNVLDITIEDIERSINNRLITGYNEWILRDFKILGVFAVEPFEISVYAEPNYPPEMPAHLRQGAVPDISRVSVNEIRAYFPSLPIYSFKDGVIVRVDADQSRKISHADIYKK